MRRIALPLILVWLTGAGLPELQARQPVRARHAMVVTRETHATDAGLAVLQSGGNAVDAAVAVGFALAVTHPSAGNLGGGGFMLIRLADGRTAFIDFRERAPAAAGHDMYLDAQGNPTGDSVVGYRASGVPGTVAGLAYAHGKFGRKAWKDLVQPAVDLAHNGFPVSWGLAQSLASERIDEKLSQFPESKRIFLKDGAHFEPGDTLVQPELAAVLERIRDQGAAGFYAGQTARQIALDMRAHGGLITAEDLAAYHAIERQPLTGYYHGNTIVTAPPPSSGGVGILQMMGILESTDYSRTGAGSAREYHFLAEAMRRYFADRSEYMGDPEFFQVPVLSLLDPAYIESRRGSIDPDKATPSSAIRPGAFAVRQESANTTHYSIVDSDGNAAAVTYTLNDSYGSGVAIAGLGFLLNDEMDDFAPKPGQPNSYGLIQGEANSIAPHKTPLSSMTPTILVRDGKLRAVLGTPGGPTIMNSVLQVALNLIDFHMNAQEAVDEPRIHHQWMPDELDVEETVSPDTVELLRAYGHNVVIRKQIGEMAVILVDGGWLQGAPDGRVEAAAKGY
jgi:gamma-glutamyltranspeptidase/glutathione hydrolase